MIKKMLIISGAVVCFLIVFTLFFYFSTQKKSENTNVETKTNNVPTTSALPIEEKSNFSNSYFIGKNDPNEIKKGFDEFVKDQLSSGEKNSTYWSKIHSDDQKDITIGQFSQAVGIRIENNIFKLLNENDYDLVTCHSKDGNTEFGLIIGVKLFRNYRDLYSDEVNFMKNWEPTMLKDLHNVLFPQSSFGQSDLEKKIYFTDDGEYRKAEINSSTSIYYNIIDDYIIITSSRECIDKTSKNILGD